MSYIGSGSAVISEKALQKDDSNHSIGEEIKKVRIHSFTQSIIYYDIMTSIRAREFSGYCGKCEFKWQCGGSRSRTYYAERNLLASDPACFYPMIIGGEETVKR